jgi:hypothetical protein
MAKSSKSAGRGTSRSMPAKRVPKGELEIGRAGGESSAGARGASRTGRSGTRKTARAARPAPQLPGEKAVRRTDASVPVGPAKTSPEDRGPTAPAAIDRRRQVTGTDELPTRTTVNRRT